MISANVFYFFVIFSLKFRNELTRKLELNLPPHLKRLAAHTVLTAEKKFVYICKMPYMANLSSKTPCKSYVQGNVYCPQYLLAYSSYISLPENINIGRVISYVRSCCA